MTERNKAVFGLRMLKKQTINTSSVLSVAQSRGLFDSYLEKGGGRGDGEGEGLNIALSTTSHALAENKRWGNAHVYINTERMGMCLLSVAQKCGVLEHTQKNQNLCIKIIIIY